VTSNYSSSTTNLANSKSQSVLSYSPILTTKTANQDLKLLHQKQQNDKKRGIITLHPNPQTLLKIEKLVLYLEGKGRGKSTQTAYTKNLYYLAQRTLDLDNTTTVELAIARFIKKDGHPATNNYKGKLCDCYARYCKFYKIFWEKPIYTPEEHSIQPPSKDICETFIASAKGKLSLEIDTSRQTGLRPCELVGEKGLRVLDIHPDQNTITARSLKGCNPRPPIKIEQSLTNKLLTYITKHQLSTNDIIFPQAPATYGKSFNLFKKRLAKKLENKSIEAIRLYDLRHYYITAKMKKIGNAEIVRQIVGHKRLNTTQKYIHIDPSESQEFIYEQTNDRKRADELSKAEYQYLYTTPDGYMEFRKPK
jgi:integrase